MCEYEHDSVCGYECCPEHDRACACDDCLRKIKHDKDYVVKLLILIVIILIIFIMSLVIQ